MITGISATIFVTDMDRAVEFYTKTLGLPLAGRWGNDYASIDLGKGASIGLHPSKSPPMPKPGTSGSIQVGMTIDKPIADIVKDLQSKGVNFRGPIIDDGQVMIAFFGDPDGNDLYLCEVKNWG